MGQPTVSGALGRLEIKLLRRSQGRTSQKTVESPGSFGSPSEAEEDTFSVTDHQDRVVFSSSSTQQPKCSRGEINSGVDAGVTEG